MRSMSNVLLYVERLNDAPLAPEIASSLRMAADLGHEVTEGTLPLDVAGLNTEWTKIGQASLAALHVGMGEAFAPASEAYQAIAK